MTSTATVTGVAAISPWVAVVVSLTVGVMGVLGAMLGVYLSDRRLNRRRLEDLRRDQLMRLYGPLWVLTKHSYRLQLLLGGDQPAWRMVDNIPAILADAEKAFLAKQVVRVGREMEGVIVACCGLALGGVVPDEFVQFLVHVEAVRAAFKTGIVSPNRPRYPHQLDEHVEEACKWLQGELAGRKDASRLP